MRFTIALIITVLFLGPLIVLVSETPPESFFNLLQSASVRKAIWVTIGTGALGAILSVIGSLFLARYFGFYVWTGKRLQRLLILIPYLVPNFVLAMAYVIAWNPTTGLLQSIIPLPIPLYGFGGLSLLFAVVHLPLAFLIIEDRYRRLDPALREAARMAGANSLRIFVQVELPLIRTSLLIASAISFALNISAFAIPAWIGAPEKLYPLTYKIYQSVQMSGPDGIPEAASFAVILFALALVPLVLTNAGQNNILVTGKPARESHLSPPRSTRLFFQTTFWISQMLLWILPLASLLASTLVKPGCLQRKGLSCFQDFSLHSYSYVLFDLAETRFAFRDSFLYGSLSALIIVVTSCLLLISFQKSKRLAAWVGWTIGLPLATPGAILAIALIVSLSGRFGINLYNTAGIVVAAFVIKHLSIVYQPLRSSFLSLSPSLVEAASLSGAGPVAIWSKIIFPLLRPEIFAGAFLVLIPILGELTMSVFLASPNFRSIGTVLFDLQDYADQSSAGALAIILVIVILLLNELCRVISHKKVGY